MTESVAPATDSWDAAAGVDCPKCGRETLRIDPEKKCCPTCARDSVELDERTFDKKLAQMRAVVDGKLPATPKLRRIAREFLKEHAL